jgi:hypothetical protein
MESLRRRAGTQWGDCDCGFGNPRAGDHRCPDADPLGQSSRTAADRGSGSRLRHGRDLCVPALMACIAQLPSRQPADAGAPRRPRVGGETMVSRCRVGGTEGGVTDRRASRRRGCRDGGWPTMLRKGRSRTACGQSSPRGARAGRIARCPLRWRGQRRLVRRRESVPSARGHSRSDRAFRLAARAGATAHSVSQPAALAHH